MHVRSHRRIHKVRGQQAVGTAVRGLKFESLENRTLLSAYSVSSSGSDSNSGSADAPWRTERLFP